MLNIGLSIVQNRVASSLSTAFADFGENPSIIAADADQNAFFLSDASTGNVLTSVSLSEFGAPTNGSGFIGFDKSGNAIEYSDGELPRTWDAANSQHIWMTDPTVTRLSDNNPQGMTAHSGSILTNGSDYGVFSSVLIRSSGQLAATGKSTITVAHTNGVSYTFRVLFKNITGSNLYLEIFGDGTTGAATFELSGSVGSLVINRALRCSATLVEEGIGPNGIRYAEVLYTPSQNYTGNIFFGPGATSGDEIELIAYQVTATDKFPGWVGGDQTVSNVDREALEWTLGSRARAAVQAATNLTVGNAWTQPSASDDERHLFQIDNASTFSVRTSSSGVAEAQAAAGTSSTGTTPAAGGHRIAAAMGSSDLSVSLDGASTVSTAGSASSLSSITTIAVGAAADGSLGVRGGINKIAIAAVDTSNADLEAWSGL